MQSISPLTFKNLPDYLGVLRLETRTPVGRRTTFREWARALGYDSPRSLGMVFEGSRVPSSDLIHRLAKLLALSDSEFRHLELLVQLERRKRRGKESFDVETALFEQSARQGVVTILDEAGFRYLADWYVLVVKQLIAAPGFRKDGNWISKRLRRKITPSQALGALQTLERLGMVRSHGGKLRVTRRNVVSTADIPNLSARRHLKEMLERAIEALSEQSLESREFDARTLRINPSRMAEIKQWLRHKRDEFSDRFEDPKSDRVFQFNQQLFEHTGENP